MVSNANGPDHLIPCIDCKDYFWSIDLKYKSCNRCR